jgi:hypothetical protein
LRYKTIIGILLDTSIRDSPRRLMAKLSGEQYEKLSDEKKMILRRSRFPDAEILPRVIAAGHALDAEPGGRLAWLLRFVREDPAKWIPEEVALHGIRLLACWFPRLPPDVVSLGPRIRLAPLTTSNVRRLHAAFREWFRQLVRVPAGVPGVEVPIPGLRMVMLRMTRPGRKPAMFRLSAGGPGRTRLFYQAAQWVVATDRLIACPECREPFLALRKRLFCSAPCLQAHHDRKKIAKRKLAMKGVPSP